MFARVAQFVLSFVDRPTAGERAFAKERLSEREWRLFEQLSPVEQAHALRVAKKALGFARSVGLSDPDERALVTAALLHDVGKSGAVGPFAKAAIVLIGRFAPALARSFCERGEREAGLHGVRKGVSRLSRAFYFHATHPDRGARMAERAGTSPRAVALIRSHHAEGASDELLEILRRADRGS